jgi:hypothetical protein
MFGKALVNDMITRSAETGADRRNFLKAAGLTGLGVVGAGAVGTAVAAPASADGRSSAPITDGAILNFALNLEYLEAEFYLHATTGRGLADSLTTGTQKRGGVTGGHAVPFKDKNIAAFASEIADDEHDHVVFLRTALGGAAVSRPQIDLQASFTAAAQAAGLIKAGQTFDPFADDASFLLGAFIFEDVGVTAYKGAAPLISNKTYLEAAAGILAVEAYHAGIVRSQLFQRGLASAADAISNARDSLDGPMDLDQGITGTKRPANIVPTDSNSIAFSRTPQQVHNIAYLNPAKGVRKGGFFPSGTNNADPRFTTS